MAPLLVLMLASLACNLMGGGDNPPTPAAATVPPAAATQPAVVTQPAATQPAATQPPESLPSPTLPPTSAAVPTQPSAAAATETTAPLPVPQTGYLGDAAEQAGYFLAAAAVEDPYTPASFYPLSPGNKVVAVEITVGNQSGELVTVNPFNSVLVDRDGTTHLPVAGGRADQLILVDLRPGQRVRGWVTFETPEAAVPAAVQYDLVGISDIPLEASLLPPPDGHTPAVPAAPASPAPLPRLGETVQQEAIPYPL